MWLSGTSMNINKVETIMNGIEEMKPANKWFNK